MSTFKTVKRKLYVYNMYNMEGVYEDKRRKQSNL